jgi:hypothetical protein
MKMAKRTGQFAQVTMDVDGTPVVLAELRDWSISVSTNKVNGDVAGTEWSEHLIGRTSWEAEATSVSVDKFWLSMVTQFIEVAFYDHADDVLPAYTGQASMDFERSAPHDDLIETSFTFTGNGILTDGTPPVGP